MNMMQPSVHSTHSSDQFTIEERLGATRQHKTEILQGHGRAGSVRCGRFDAHAESSRMSGLDARVCRMSIQVSTDSRQNSEQMSWPRCTRLRARTAIFLLCKFSLVMGATQIHVGAAEIPQERVGSESTPDLINKWETLRQQGIRAAAAAAAAKIRAEYEGGILAVLSEADDTKGFTTGSAGGVQKGYDKRGGISETAKMRSVLPEGGAGSVPKGHGPVDLHVDASGGMLADEVRSIGKGIPAGVGLSDEDLWNLYAGHNHVELREDVTFSPERPCCCRPNWCPLNYCPAEVRA